MLLLRRRRSLTRGHRAELFHHAAPLIVVGGGRLVFWLRRRLRLRLRTNGPEGVVWTLRRATTPLRRVRHDHRALVRSSTLCLRNGIELRTLRLSLRFCSRRRHRLRRVRTFYRSDRKRLRAVERGTHHHARRVVIEGKIERRWRRPDRRGRPLLRRQLRRRLQRATSRRRRRWTRSIGSWSFARRHSLILARIRTGRRLPRHQSLAPRLRSFCRT